MLWLYGLWSNKKLLYNLYCILSYDTIIMWERFFNCFFVCLKLCFDKICKEQGDAINITFVLKFWKRLLFSFSCYTYKREYGTNGTNRESWGGYMNDIVLWQMGVLFLSVCGHFSKPMLVYKQDRFLYVPIGWILSIYQPLR